MTPPKERNLFERSLTLLGLNSKESVPEAEDLAVRQDEPKVGHTDQVSEPTATPRPSEESGGEIERTAPELQNRTVPETALPTRSSPEPAAAPQPVPLDAAAKRHLREVGKLASWSGQEAEKTLKGLVDAFNETYPGNDAAIKNAIAEGKARSAVKGRAYKIASQKGKQARELDEVRRQAADLHISPDVVERQIDKGHACFVRWTGANKKKQSGAPLSTVVSRPNASPATKFISEPLSPRRVAPDVAIGLHANDVRALSPAPTWRIIVDETGDVFGPDAHKENSRRLGRFIAIALPVAAEVLKPLPTGWHAADCSNDAEIDQVFQCVLDANVGVLGVCVTALPITPGERWADGVGLLIDWIVRLLPMSGPTRLEVLVEQRGVFGAGHSWELVARESLRRLALAFPRRAAMLDVTINVIRKDGSPLNGYVDALAFTWSGATETSRERLKRSGLRGTCLLEQDAREMLYAWDAFAQGVDLPPHRWWDLVASPDTNDASSILCSFLDLVGLECQADPRRWANFLSHARHQMAAGPVDLRRLAAAVNWLQRFQPTGALIPPLLRMSWLTVQLAKANHMGLTETGWVTELERMVPPLIEEAAPLVCHADLHLAVGQTNRFDFTTARNTLRRWQDVPPAVPGLQCWGQVQSSLGQHAAFLGENREAIRLFDAALEAFGRLSDPATRSKEMAQTACYRAIATMDEGTSTPSEARVALEKAIGPLAKEVPSLAASADPAQRYAHHLLLRWLTHRGDREIRSAYLSQRPDWKTGEGHPWPLIQLYRGLLIAADDREVARELALEAAAIAFTGGQGPVVRLIGACCRAVASSWGAPWPAAEAEIEGLRSALPLADARLSALSTWLKSPADKLTLLQEVLPFNFR